MGLTFQPSLRDWFEAGPGHPGVNSWAMFMPSLRDGPECAPATREQSPELCSAVPLGLWASIVRLPRSKLLGYVQAVPPGRTEIGRAAAPRSRLLGHAQPSLRDWLEAGSGHPGVNSWAMFTPSLRDGLEPPGGSQTGVPTGRLIVAQEFTPGWPAARETESQRDD